MRAVSWTACSAAVLLLHATSWAEKPPGFSRQWGGHGVGRGQFSTPLGVALDSRANVYVVDGDNSRVQKFTSEGTFVAEWGSYGSGAGQFIQPSGVAVGPGDTIYVSDTGNRRIERFMADGSFVGAWDARTAGGSLGSPGFIATDAGAVYVILGCTIAKYTGSGTYLNEWGSCGSGAGQFSDAGGVALDAHGDIYVTDGGNNRIQKFTSGGAFITQWVVGPGHSANGPYGIAIDPEGNVYATFTTQHKAKKYTAAGVELHSWGAQGNGNGQFDWPTGIAVDASGDIYIGDTHNDRIEVFSPTVAVQPSTWTAVKSMYRNGFR